MIDDDFLAEGEDQNDAPTPILRSFAQSTKVKVLSGLAELSYVAGREGDDEWAWATEAEDALIDAFFNKPGEWNSKSTRYQRLATIQATLAAAFRGGCAQREIDLALAGPDGPHRYTSRQNRDVVVSERAMAHARAHAVIYADEIQFPLDRHPENIRREIGYVATKIAQRHPVTKAEAAYCALAAFEGHGLAASLETAAWALDRAASGHAEREALEANAEERAREITVATALLFEGDE